MVYTVCFFLFKMQFVSYSNLFGPCIIHILYTVCAKIKKNNSGAKRLTEQHCNEQEMEILSIILGPNNYE